MIQKIKSLLAWIQVTFLSSSVLQTRYVPIKIPFADLQKEFYNFFVLGSKVRFYDFSSSKGNFLIHENRPNVTQNPFPLISYKVSETDNEYLIKLEVGNRFEPGSHFVVLCLKWFFFFASLLFIIIGLYFLVTSSFDTSYYIMFLVPIVILSLLAGFSRSSSYAISKANARLINAIKAFEAGNQIDWF